VAQIEQQLCLAHAIQLAVVDVLYGKKSKTTEDIEGEEDDEEIEEEEDEDESVDVCEDAECSDVLNVEMTYTEVGFENKEIEKAIGKVRRLGGFFKRSAVNNEILQSYVKKQFNNPSVEKKLLVDCKTRWSSLFIMLERYYEIRDSVDKTLIDIKSTQRITESEKFLFCCILNVLKPVMLTVKVGFSLFILANLQCSSHLTCVFI
jgi:hypothetical protein